MLNSRLTHLLRDFLFETKSRRPRTSCDRRARKMWEVAMSARIGLAVISLSLLWSTRGWSADLRVMSGGAPQEVLAALTPEFENRTGHKATFSFAVITTLEQRLASGERTDTGSGRWTRIEDSWVVEQRVGWCAMRRGGEP